MSRTSYRRQSAAQRQAVNARFQLDAIRELADDPQAYGGRNATLSYHARSANNYLDTLRRAGEPLPDFILASGVAYFKGIGWNVDRWPV